MKTRIMTAAAALLLAAAGRAAAQYADDLPEELIEKEKEPLRVALTLRLSEISHAHDAVQHRADYDDSTRRHWQQGSVDGDGWGLTLSVKQGPGELTLRTERLDHRFDARPPGSPSNRHQIDTRREDWEILYWHTREGKDDAGEKGAWGWMVGVRHVASRKQISIREGAAALDTEGDITWKMLQGGYWGVYRPAAWQTRLFGSLSFLFGEVDGLSRYKNDTKWDRRIRETYRDDQGLAYGLGFTLGAGVDFLKYCSFNLGYRREWLYSFQATDSGIVVFPDNDDALFIENIGGLYAEIGARFQF